MVYCEYDNRNFDHRAADSGVDEALGAWEWFVNKLMY